MHPRNACAPQAANVILPEYMGSAAGRHECRARFAHMAAKGPRLVCIRKGFPAGGASAGGCHVYWLRPCQVARPQDHNKRAQKTPGQSTLACVLACTLVQPGWSRVLCQTRAGGPWSGWSTGWRASWACTHAGGCRARRSASTRSAAPAPPASPPRSGPTAARWSRTSTASARPTRQARRPCRPIAKSENPAPNGKLDTHLIGACPALCGRHAPLVACDDRSHNPILHARHTHLQCICPPCAAGPTTVR